MKKKLALLFILALLPSCLSADNCANLPVPAVLTPNGNELTPRMGWDSWYPYGADVTEAQIKTQADLLVSLGLKALGYTWVGYDETQRTRTGGVLAPSATAFPDGYAATNAYVHADGLKVMMYSSPNSTTCAGNPGSLTFESSDATNFASIGADGLYYDGCSVASAYASCWTASGPQVWQMMAQDARATSTNFVLVVGTVSDPWFTNLSWQRNAGWNEMRVPLSDINGNWSIYDSYMDFMAEHSGFAQPGTWIMADFISGPASGWSDTQIQTQFGLDALWSSPLILGADLSTLTSAELAIFKNTRIIAIDQDSLGKVAIPFIHQACGSSFCDAWQKPLSDGSYALGFVNRSTTVQTMNASMAAYGGYVSAVDDYSGASLGVISNYSVTLQPYQSSIITVTRVNVGTSLISGSIVHGGMR